MLLSCFREKMPVSNPILLLGPGLQEGRQQEAGVDLHQVQPEGPEVRRPGQPQTLQEALAIGLPA